MKRTNGKTGKEKETSAPQGVSRRDFLKKSALGAGVAAVALGSAKSALAADDAKGPDELEIRIPEEIPRTQTEPAKPGSFEGNGMTGAQVFARACREEGLAALFCCPGNYTIINAIAAEGIPSFGGRTEESMCAAADGFIRLTGEIAATSGTEGPGFTNMIMQISAANACRTPLLVLASNVRLTNEDRESGIQMQLQQPITSVMKKYGKRLITANRVHEYAGYAFRALKTGVPGPVHLDFPGEVANARFKDASELTMYWDKTKYRTESVPNPAPKEITAAVDMIQKAERPMIVAGSGVFYRKAWDALKLAAEKNDIAVAESGPCRGHFSDGHRLAASTAPNALMSVDLVIFIGQYSMPNVGEYRFSPDVKAIRIHPEAIDLGRNWPLDLGIVSEEKVALEALADALPQRSRDTWTAELAAARKSFEDQNDEYYQLGLKHSADTGLIHPACIARGLSDFLYKGDIPKEQTTFVQGGWTGSHWTRRYIRAYRPGQVLNGPYQYYSIGPDFGYTFGAGAAVQMGVGPQAPYKGAPVFGFTGDAGAGYSIMEMDTMSKYKIPAIMIVYNNNAWGVWGSGSRTARSQHMYLFQENIRYDKIAEGLGARGEYVTSPEEFTAALKRSYEVASADGVSTLINCQSKKEFTTRQYPPGTPRNASPGVGAYSH